MTTQEGRKNWSENQLKRLNKKVNAEFIMDRCPVCGGTMDSHPEHYEMSDMVVYFWCEECNIAVTHGFKWCDSEVEQHQKEA